MSRRTHSRAPVTALVLVLGLGACSAPGTGPEADPSPAPGATSVTPEPSGAAVAAVPTKHLVGRVSGRLPRAARARLVRQVGPVLDGWLDAAFVAGPFPREVAGAWSGFTAGAARRARADRQLTSLGDLAARIDGVRVTKRAVRYTVLAPGGRPAGVTARLTLDLHTTGEVERKVSVRGRLALAPVRADGRRTWKVFAHDLSREGR